MSSRHDDERLTDIIDAIRSHLARGDLSDGLIFDAVRVRLIEIGEAVKTLDLELVASQPDVKWSDAAGMRDLLAHHYFDTSRATVEVTIMEDLPSLEAAVRQLQIHRKPTEEHPGSLPGEDWSQDSGLGN